MKTATLRPGLLVSLKTSVKGNVSYSKKELGSQWAGSALVDKWETERTIEDVAEAERAKVARGKCRSLVTGICTQSAFGLLCPDNRSLELDDAIAGARQLAQEFNETATYSTIEVYVMAGRIAESDVEAIRALSSEVRDLIDDMVVGVERLDVKAVRDAANKARDLGQMLSPDAKEHVEQAISAARKAARAIVKAGDQAAEVIDQAAIRAITDARVAFLELDDVAEAIEILPVAGRGLDLEPEESVAEPMPVAANAAVLDL